MTDLLTTIVLPSAAILIPTVLAITLAVLERRAARRARAQERTDRVSEDVLESLAFFVSANPIAEEMAPEMRRLRSRVALLQTLPGARIRRVGLWLALEVEIGLPLYSAAMVIYRQIENPSIDDHLEVFRLPQKWFHDCMVRLTVWMRGEVKDEAIEERIDQLSKGAISPRGPTNAAR